MRLTTLLAALAALSLGACQQAEPPAATQAPAPHADDSKAPQAETPSRFDIYATVRLTADL